MSTPTIPRPPDAPVIAENLPPELLAGDRFIVWRWTWKEPSGTAAGKWDKPPFSARTGNPVDVTKPANGADALVAIAAAERYGMSGIGRQLFAEDGLIAWDYDDCYDPITQAITDPDVEAEIRALNSYGEITASRTGLRVWGTGAIERSRTRKGQGSREVYSSTRYIALTGWHLDGTPRELNDIQAATDHLIAKHWPPQPERTRVAAPELRADDVEIVERVRKTAKGDRLITGNADGYPSGSEADQALANLFVWAHADADQAERLLAQFSLAKGNKRERVDYLRRTVAKAIADVDPGYQEPRRTGAAIVDPMPQDAALLDAGAPCDIRLAAALREIDRLRQENADIRLDNETLRGRVQLADQQLATFRNPNLGACKAVGAALIEIFRHEAPAKPGDPMGYRAPLAKLADRTGQSADTCSRQIKSLAKFTQPDGSPILHWKVIDVAAGVDSITGEIDAKKIGRHKELWIGPAVEPQSFGAVLAKLAPIERKPWGGVRDDGVCADHPEDGVIQRTTYQKHVTFACAVCNEVLLEKTEAIAGKYPVVRHLPRIPTQQVAPSTTVENEQPSKLRHRESGPLRDLTQQWLAPPSPEEFAAAYERLNNTSHASADRWTS